MPKKQKPKRRRWHELIDRLPEATRLIGAEVGVWEGAMSSQLLRARPMLRLLMVDRWMPPPAEDSYFTSGSKIARMNASAFDAARAKALAAVAFAGHRAQIRQMHSHEAAAAVVDASLDFVFIDGDHSLEGCSADIQAWLPKVKPGGWICGHDYDHPKQGQVKQAVLSWFAESEIQLGANRTWFVQWPPPNRPARID